MQIFYSQHILHLCSYTGTVCTSPQWLSQNLESGFSRRLLHIRNLGLKYQGEVMLKRRLDCSQNPATPADLRKDVWKAKERECTEINAFTPQMIFVHPRSAGFETQGNERNAGASFNQFCKKYLSYGQGVGTIKKAITTGTCIWFV